MDFSIDIKEKNGLRSLHFDARWMQGAMRIAQPWALELEYTRVMMASLLLREASHFPQNVLLIGLGAGSLAKFLYRYFPLAQLTIVEIDTRVVKVASENFALPDDPLRINIVIGDGVEYIQASSKTFDLILVDGFNERAHPGDLNTLSFYRACRSRLSDQGVLAVNLVGLCRGVKGGFAHIESAFDQRALMFPKCKSGNTIAFAVAGEAVSIALSELKRKAIIFAERTGLPLIPNLCQLEQEDICHNVVLSI